MIGLSTILHNFDAHNSWPLQLEPPKFLPSPDAAKSDFASITSVKLLDAIYRLKDCSNCEGSKCAVFHGPSP